MMRHRGREASVAVAIGLLCLVLAAAAPQYFSTENLNDLFLANMPVFVVALGATLDRFILLPGFYQPEPRVFPGGIRREARA